MDSNFDYDKFLIFSEFSKAFPKGFATRKHPVKQPVLGTKLEVLDLRVSADLSDRNV